MPRLTETRAARAPLPASGQTFLWCSEVRGFGCRLTPGARSWVVQVRQTGADTFAAGTRAVIYEYDSAGEFFWVVPADLPNRSKDR